MSINPLLAAAVGAFFRWALTFVAGYVVKAGIWTGDEATTYVVAGTAALVSLAWSLYQKYRTKVVVQAALDARPGTTEAELRTYMKAEGQ